MAPVSVGTPCASPAGGPAPDCRYGEALLKLTVKQRTEMQILDIRWPSSLLPENKNSEEIAASSLNGEGHSSLEEPECNSDYSTVQTVGSDSQNNCTDSLDSEIQKLSVSDPVQQPTAMETDQPASTVTTTGPPRHSQPSTSAALPPVDTLEEEGLDYEEESGSEEVMTKGAPWS